jgi:hypothetical protein
LVVRDTGWIRGSRESWDPAGEDVGAKTPPANPAMRPEDPWVGSVGVRPISGPGYEAGAGVLIPADYVTANQPANSPEAVRATGVGLWLILDF